MAGIGTPSLRQVLTGILGALVCAVSLAPADAETRINTTVRYYDIEGDSVAELKYQMLNLGPFSDRSNSHVPARMESQVDFRFVSQWRRGACHVERIRVTADITYHYPRWLGFEEARLQLADKWAAYLSRLAEHEEGHGAIVVQAVHDVEAALASMAPSRSCKRLRAAARARGAEIFTRARQAQIDYDEETGGGETQGAVLRDREGVI